MVAKVKSFETTFSQRRYKVAIKAARRFSSDHVAENAEDFWRRELNRPVNVYKNTGTPIGTVTPRSLQRVLGNGWFLVSDDEAQVMTTMSAGQVIRKLKDVREDMPCTSTEIMNDIPQCMRAAVSSSGTELYRCGEAEFGQIYLRVLQAMPMGSYEVFIRGVRLRQGLRALGYDTHETFKAACRDAVGRAGQKKIESLDTSHAFTVHDANRTLLYACEYKRAAVPIFLCQKA